MATFRYYSKLKLNNRMRDKLPFSSNGRTFFFDFSFFQNFCKTTFPPFIIIVGLISILHEKATYLRNFSQQTLLWIRYQIFIFHLLWLSRVVLPKLNSESSRYWKFFWLGWNCSNCTVLLIISPFSILSYGSNISPNSEPVFGSQFFSRSLRPWKSQQPQNLRTSVLRKVRTY